MTKSAAATKFLKENQHKRSIADDAMHLKELDPLIGNVPLRQLHMGSLQGFIAKRKGDGVKSSTINGALAITRHILKLAGEEWMDGQGITWLEPLPADLDEKVYKLLFLDVGLMNAICGLGWKILSKLDDIQLVNEGAIAEQFIGQHQQELLAESPNRELTYWLREGRSSNAEVDFVVAFEGQIVPIEVKAGGRGSLRSLHQFVREKNVPLAVRFDSNPPSTQTVSATIQTGDRATDVKYRLLSPCPRASSVPKLLTQRNPCRDHHRKGARTNSSLKILGKFGDVPNLLGLHERCRKNPLAGLRKQGIESAGISQNA